MDYKTAKENLNKKVYFIEDDQILSGVITVAQEVRTFPNKVGDAKSEEVVLSIHINGGQGTYTTDNCYITEAEAKSVLNNCIDEKVACLTALKIK